MKGSSYKETEWKNGETRLNAKNMNNIEAGIKTLFEKALDKERAFDRFISHADSVEVHGDWTKQKEELQRRVAELKKAKEK